MMSSLRYYGKRRFSHRGFAIIIALLCPVLSIRAQETNTYHTNRVFHKVTFTIPGVPTAFEVCKMAGQLTTVVGPTNVITNSFYATERQSVVVGYGADAPAWSAAVGAYPSNAMVHTNYFYDNAGWVKGLYQTWDGNWGGYIWVMQNTVNFKTSPTNVWVSTNGVTNAISKVLVGTIGDYSAMTVQSDTGPTLEGMTNNPRTSGSSNDMRYAADFTAYYDIGLPTLWIQPMLTNVCINSGTVTFSLATNSTATNGVAWSITPEGLTHATTLTNIVIDVGGVATSYVVKATAFDNTNIFGFAVLNVLKVEMEASKNVLTIKHDRDCNLEVKTVPVDISADQYKIEIKRTNSATWYTLSTNKTMTPWHANIAGGFHLRGMAKISGTECYSTNIVVVNQFPTYTQIEGDADVRSATDTEWANTLTDCTETPNQRRERGFWIQVNTISNIYQHTTTFTGPWVGPTQGASATPGTTPADVPTDPAPNAIGAVYTVACFHTHTPTTYWSTNDYRPVGPSGPLRGDVPFHNSRERVGIVYDYIGDFQGRIYGGHPEGASAQRYQVGPTLRPLP